VTHVLAAVIYRAGRYLICQRPPHKRHGGLWEFPGGKLEEGESLEAAAKRELTEELGVRVTGTGGLLLSVADPGSEFVIDFVEAEIEGEPSCREHSALAWVEPREISHYALAPSDRAFADHLLVAPRPTW
jgi:8-oxo-dGTP diphosphatase